MNIQNKPQKQIQIQPNLDSRRIGDKPAEQHKSETKSVAPRKPAKKEKQPPRRVGSSGRG
jgi:hypothetical protein